MNNDNEESISFVGHTNLPYEIEGEEMSQWQEAGCAIGCAILFYILTVLVLCL